MKKNDRALPSCAVCGKEFPPGDVVIGEALRPQIADQTRIAHPDGSASSHICRANLGTFRPAYVQSILETEKGELSSLDREVLESIHKHELISENVDLLSNQRARLVQIQEIQLELLTELPAK